MNRRSQAERPPTYEDGVMGGIFIGVGACILLYMLAVLTRSVL